MRVAYFASPNSVHDAKWIHYQMAHQGVEPLVFGPPYPEARRALDPQIEVLTWLPSSYPALKFWQRRPILARIRRELRARKVQMLHSMYAVPYALWADESGTLPHLITTRGSDLLVDYQQTYRHPQGLSQRLSYGLMRLNLALAFQRAVAITCTSQAQAELARRLCGQARKVHLVRTGVDVRSYALLERSLAQRLPEHAESRLLSGLEGPRRELRLFCPRSMKPLYNLHLLLEAFAQLRSLLPEHRLQLVLIDDLPETGYAQQIRAQATALGLQDAVEFLPKLDAEGMAEQYYRADLVLMIPQSDGTPVSAIEAMLMRRPVLLGPLAYDQDIFHAGTCWQLSSLAPADIAASLRHLLVEEPTRAYNEKTLAAYLEAERHANRQREMEKVTALYRQYARPSRA